MYTYSLMCVKILPIMKIYCATPKQTLMIFHPYFTNYFITFSRISQFYLNLTNLNFSYRLLNCTLSHKVVKIPSDNSVQMLVNQLAFAVAVSNKIDSGLICYIYNQKMYFSSFKIKYLKQSERKNELTLGPNLSNIAVKF